MNSVELLYVRVVITCEWGLIVEILCVSVFFSALVQFFFFFFFLRGKLIY
jgi:hypothetical protein